MTPIVDIIKEAACVIIAPTPRYVSRRCCTSADHLENYKTCNYETKIQEGVDSHIQMLDTWATEHGLQYVILDPITTEETSVSDLRDRTVSSGESLWSAADGVHLSAPSQRSRNRCPRMTLQTRRRLSLWQTAPPRRGPGWT
jgi:hypothetical protein